MQSKLLLISNLLLGEKSVRASAPDLDSFLVNSPLNSGRNSSGNHWDALRASRMLASKKPFSSLMVLSAGIEPALPVPQTGVLSVERQEPKNVTNIPQKNKTVNKKQF